MVENNSISLTSHAQYHEHHRKFTQFQQKTDKSSPSQIHYKYLNISLHINPSTVFNHSLKAIIKNQMSSSFSKQMTYICGKQFLFFFLVSLVGVVCEARGLVPASNSQRGFVRTRNTQFVLNGSPFLFNGFNSYWMMHVAADPTERYKISNVFQEASAAGLTVCRTWAFNDGGDGALQMSPGIYDERVFQALDFVISEAKKYGVRLILSLVNNYNDYGGRPQYTQWARSAGVQVSGDDDFYTNSVIKGYYKNHVKRVLTRFNTVTRMAYKDDPTIMAWELINEPRCKIDYSGKTVQGWFQEMATYTKSIDAKHLLEIGMEGFYGDSMPEKKQNNPGYEVGTDFITNNMIQEIDFATIHAYPDIWLSGQNDNSQLAFMQRWMTSHFSDSKSILKKPLVFSEFGKSKKDQGYSLTGRNSYLNAIYRNIYNFARTGGTIGGGLVWQLVAEGMESYYDGYEIVLSQNPSTSGIITGQSRKMEALGHMLSTPHGGNSFSREHDVHNLLNKHHGHQMNHRQHDLHQQHQERKRQQEP